MKFNVKTITTGKNKWMVLFSMALFISVFLAAFAYTKNRDQNYQRSAEAFLAENRFKEAVIQFKNVLQKDPENEYACMRLSQVYYRLNEPENEMAALDRAISINPENLDAQLRLGQVYLRVGRIQKAHDTANLLLSKDPVNIQAMQLLSSVLVQERNATEALKTLEGAIEIDPENAGLYANLGYLLYYGKKNFVKSEQALLKAISLDNSLPGPYELLSRIYAMEDQIDKLETLLIDWTKTPGNPLQKFVLLAKFYESRKNLEKAEATYLDLLGDGKKKDGALLQMIGQFYAKTGQFAKAAMYFNQVPELDKNPDVQSELANVYLKMKAYEDAQEMVSGILDRTPDHSRARLTGCKLLIVRQSYNAAIEKLDELIAIDDSLAEAYFLKALCLGEDLAPLPGQKFRMAESNDFSVEIWKLEQAVKALKKAVDLSPDYFLARMTLSDLYVKKQDLIQAETQLEYVLDRLPENPIALLKFGNIKIMGREWKAAEKIFHRLVEIQPGASLAHDKLGTALFAQKNMDGAIAAFTKALELDPSSMAALGNLVNSYMITGEKESALQMLNTRLSRPEITEREKAYTGFLLGKIALSEGHVDQARKYFHGSVTTFKEITPAHEALAALAIKDGDLLMAADHYRQILSYDPTFFPARISLSRIYLEQDNVPEAMQALESILEIQDSHASAANDLAYLLAGEGRDLERALRLAQVAVSQEPDNPGFLDTLGWVHLKQQDHDLAVDRLKESLDINPDSADANYHLGLAYFEINRAEESRAHLRLAMKIDPGFAGSEKAEDMLGE